MDTANGPHWGGLRAWRMATFAEAAGRASPGAQEMLDNAENKDGGDSDDEAEPFDGVQSLLAKANALKAEGNEAFKAGRFSEAASLYADAIVRLTSSAAKKALKEWWDSSAQEDTASPLLVTLHTNRAVCHVKLEQWESAVLSATKALEMDPWSTKARFRRGVACSHLGRMEEAKVDLTAVAKADPKNREARTVLEVVNAALKERRATEKDMFSKAFAGPSLYADEEAKAAREAQKAKAAKEREAAALLDEWREECARRRSEGPTNVTAELLKQAAAKGDAEARTALDRLAPISLDEFGKQRAAEREKKEKKQQALAKVTHGGPTVPTVGSPDGPP